MNGLKKNNNMLYTEEEVEKILGVQRRNCYVAVLKVSNSDTASTATNAPEPGMWRKKEVTMEVDYPKVGSVYKHYKGGLYEVKFLSKHSENDEILVNYQSLHFGSYHSRPLNEWNKETTTGSPRFKLT